MSLKPSIKNKKGFTIVELLIGILISGIIALGVAMVYFAIRNSQNAQNSISEIRDSTFVALDRIEYAIKHANFVDYNETNNSYDTSDKTKYPSAPFDKDNSIDGTNVTINDKFTIQFVVPEFSKTGANTSEMVDCAGATLPASALVKQTFAINNSNLECTVNVNSTTNTVVIANGIRNMQVFYSTFDANGCGTANPTNPWKSATKITADDAWASVCAVNISLLSISQTKQLVKANDSIINKEFVLAPNDLSAQEDSLTKTQLTATSNLIENARVFNRVIHLRN